MFDIDSSFKYSADRFNEAIGTKGTFMSNFFQLSIPIPDAKGNLFYNSEGWYMAARTNNSIIKRNIAIASKLGGSSSRNSRNLYTLDQNVPNRVSYMREAITLKFDYNTDLKDELLKIDKEIIEKNWWHDTLFGVDSTSMCGANVLGKLLMEYIQNNK